MLAFCILIRTCLIMTRPCLMLRACLAVVWLSGFTLGVGVLVAVMVRVAVVAMATEWEAMAA